MGLQDAPIGAADGTARRFPAFSADQQVGLGGAKGRVQRDGPPGRGSGRLMVAHVTVEKAEEVLDLGVIGIQGTGLGEALAVAKTLNEAVAAVSLS